MKVDQDQQRTDVLDDLRARQDRTTLDQIEFRAQLLVIALDISYPRIIHYKAACTIADVHVQAALPKRGISDRLPTFRDH
jgi:hypothetical protein